MADWLTWVYVASGVLAVALLAFLALFGGLLLTGGCLAVAILFALYLDAVTR